jgi:hypothetical protein
MPRKPAKPAPKHYQEGRTHLRVSITLSPAARQDLDVIRDAEGLVTISGAIAQAAHIARDVVERRSGKNFGKIS